jgi:hypothetical protein
LLGGDGGNEGVSGEGGEVVEKGSEAVDREAVLAPTGSFIASDDDIIGLSNKSVKLRTPSNARISLSLIFRTDNVNVISSS